MPAAIQVHNLQKSYKSVKVLCGVSFAVQKGTIFALLGANGAGKTTTINILTTLLRADDGKATIDGYDVATQSGKVRQRISLTGQFAAVDEVLTARENLLLVGELRHIKSPSAAVDELLRQFDLKEAADRRAATFSGGMRRRLDIAMSLIGEPSVIFLDEPTSGLDPQSRAMMWEKIKDLAKRGTTVFLTTQYLEEADQLADRIAILNQGKIGAEGTAAQLKKMLPKGRIELVFPDKTQLQRAAKLLKNFDTSTDDESLTLTVISDGDVKQIAQLFARLDTESLEIVEFSQKMPTLDDVFLQIVNGHKEEK